MFSTFSYVVNEHIFKLKLKIFFLNVKVVYRRLGEMVGDHNRDMGTFSQLFLFLNLHLGLCVCLFMLLLILLWGY